MSKRDKEFYDLVYDVWQSGGNPDGVSRDRFEDVYDSHYDFVSDIHILHSELKRQQPKE